jgi:hypothetical protein
MPKVNLTNKFLRQTISSDNKGDSGKEGISFYNNGTVEGTLVRAKKLKLKLKLKIK